MENLQFCTRTNKFLWKTKKLKNNIYIYEKESIIGLSFFFYNWNQFEFNLQVIKKIK